MEDSAAACFSPVAECQHNLRALASSCSDVGTSGIFLVPYVYYVKKRQSPLIANDTSRAKDSPQMASRPRSWSIRGGEHSGHGCHSSNYRNLSVTK